MSNILPLTSLCRSRHPVAQSGSGLGAGVSTAATLSPAARIVQGVAASDLVVDPPVVMTRVPDFKNEFAGRPGA
eukprot:1877115-Prymnesium_polylepis.1